MRDNSYLIFSLHDRRYGINRSQIEEVFSLPELMALPDASPPFIGAVNFRGEGLPILDLSVSFGQAALNYHLTDIVVVLKCWRSRVGMVVHEVHEVRSIHSEEIEAVSDRELNTAEQRKIIAGSVGTISNILILNHPEDWLNQEQVIAAQALLNSDSDPDQFDHPLSFNDLSASPDAAKANQLELFATATAAEKAILRKRANNLKQAIDNSEQQQGLKPIVVVGLGNQVWGIDLALVREFTDLSNIKPVPCCPTHIVGNINLRGEILTILDLRKWLDLPPIGIPENAKAMVIAVEDIVAGVLVEEVRDAMFFLNLQDMQPHLPDLLEIDREFVQGVAPYGEEIMGILDLPNILLKGGLVVDEAI
jgi:purine-binding chemotaxis protein CheW